MAQEPSEQTPTGLAKEGNWVSRTSKAVVKGVAAHENIAIAVPAAVAAAALFIPNKKEEVQQEDGTTTTESKGWGAGKITAVSLGSVATVGAAVNKWGPGEKAKGWIGRLAEKGAEAAEHIRSV